MRKIHLIFKTHLDVGFTDFAHNVVANYFEHYIPQAIRVASELRARGSSERFVWTTGSWLIYEYLEGAAPDARARMEDAILAGDIVWHGLPFTTHTELMDADLLRFGLSLSQELDQRFGKRTIAAKMTDVPGHTRGMVPLLAEAGIRFLHIGVNAASTAPAVPPVFVWRDPSGAEVIVMYHKGSYGDLMVVPGLDDAICFAHTGDNLGPQPAQEIQAIFGGMRRRLPGTKVMASTMDAFAASLLTIRDRLPVVTQELGDTWIHGTGTDPQKVAHYRELLRLRRRWLAEGRTGREESRFKIFSRALLMVPEHTWGLDVKTHLDDYVAYSAARFAAARDQPNFRKMEASWDEQRGYVHAAVEALAGSPLAAEVHDSLHALQPAWPNLKKYKEVNLARATFETAHFRLGFDAQTGAITRLLERRTGKRWASARHPLGEFRYQSFDQTDYDRYHRQYVNKQEEIAWWAIPDFTKPGIADAGATSQEWLPRLERVYHRQDPGGHTIVLFLTGEAEACTAYGCPRDLVIEVKLPDAQPSVAWTLQWYNKSACRLPEALWVSFVPAVPQPRDWFLEKLGELVSPLDVVRNGNRTLHAVGSGVYYDDGERRLAIKSFDAPLVAPGRRALLTFDNRQPPLRLGMHFLLANNVWGTNFPMWFGEDARFRFRLEFGQV